MAGQDVCGWSLCLIPAASLVILSLFLTISLHSVFIPAVGCQQLEWEGVWVSSWKDHSSRHHLHRSHRLCLEYHLHKNVSGFGASNRRWIRAVGTCGASSWSGWVRASPGWMRCLVARAILWFTACMPDAGWQWAWMGRIFPTSGVWGLPV